MKSCADYAADYRAGITDTTQPMAGYLSDNYAIKGGRLLMTNGRPLHPNARLLAETIMQLRPQSVSEFGCGCAANLYNVSRLLPDAKLFGYELCKEQLDLSRELFPTLKANLIQQDIGKPFAAESVDVAFSHVVLMHLDTESEVLAALSNMLESARRLVLLENWTARNFVEDIQSLASGYHFYTRPSPEFGRKHILIVSRTKLDYTPLMDYEIELAEPVRQNYMNDYLKFGRKDWAGNEQ